MAKYDAHQKGYKVKDVPSAEENYPVILDTRTSSCYAMRLYTLRRLGMLGGQFLLKAEVGDVDSNLPTARLFLLDQKEEMVWFELLCEFRENYPKKGLSQEEMLLKVADSMALRARHVLYHSIHPALEVSKDEPF